MKRTVSDKQLEEMYSYPFCRRCKEKLNDERMAECVEKREAPLCLDCRKALMASFKKCQPIMQKLFQR